MHLAVHRLGILFVSLVEFQDHVRRQAIFGDDSGNQRVHRPFQLLNGTAVDAEFRRKSVSVYFVLVSIQEFPDTGLNNDAAVRDIGNLYNGAFQKVSYTRYQGIVIDGVCDFRRGNRQFIRDGDFLSFFKIGRSGKTDDGVDSIIFSPPVHDGTELDLVTDGVMHFINKDGQTGELPDQIAQLIGLPILVIVALLKKAQLSLLFLNAVEDHLFRVCHGYKAKQLG